MQFRLLSEQKSDLRKETAMKLATLGWIGDQ